MTKVKFYKQLEKVKSSPMKYVLITKSDYTKLVLSKAVFFNHAFANIENTINFKPFNK